MSDDKKLAPPTFTQIQDNLMELHEKLFPEAKTITKEDHDFLDKVNEEKPIGKELDAIELWRENKKFKEVIQAAYELRHVKFGREYKKACQKFDKLYEELEKK